MKKKLIAVGAASALTLTAGIPAIAQQANDATFGEQNVNQSQEASITQNAAGEGDATQNANVAFGDQNAANSQANNQANLASEAQYEQANQATFGSQNAGQSQNAAVEQYAEGGEQTASVEFGEQNSAQEQYNAQANIAAETPDEEKTEDESGEETPTK